MLDSLEKALFCVGLIRDNKGVEPVVLELKGTTSLTDYFIVCSGTSDRHVQAIAEHIEGSMKAEGTLALGIEGLKEGKWVLLDYDDVIMHVFQKEERSFYDLENLWGECPRIPIPEVA